MNGISDNSEILKNAMVIKINITNNARIKPINLDHDLPKLLNTASAIAIPTAKIKSCRIEIVNGPILKVIPANIHFLIFLG